MCLYLYLCNYYSHCLDIGPAYKVSESNNNMFPLHIYIYIYIKFVIFVFEDRGLDYRLSHKTSGRTVLCTMT